MAVEDLDAMSLMPLETPVLKVSRPVAACSRCRNAKIKCDGKLPACSSCEKNGRAAECTSTNDQFARGKERSYVSTLETRIDRLQQKLEEAQARKPSVVSLPDDDTAVPSRRQSAVVEEVPEPPTPNTSRKLKRKEVSAIDDLVSDFGFLSVNATARDFYGFTSAMSYARLILSACTKDELPQGTTKALPPRYVATALIQHYLNNIFVLLPMFDESSLYASVDNVYAKDFRKADPLDHWMVRLILAIASASMSEQRGDQHYMEGIGHVCAALEDAESVLHPGSISGVQALILLTQYAMLDPHHFDSWSLIGAASRTMTDLGLHQDPPKGAPMTKYKLELRRRVFHCVYALDRSTSLVQTRAFSLSDDSAKVKIPFHKQPNSAPSSPQPGMSAQPKWLQSNEQALDMIHLRQMQSAWYTDLFQSGRTRWEDPYTYLWDTCDSMRRWFENISPSTPPNLRAFFELDLLYSYVYVLSPSPRVPVILPFAQKLIFEYCIRYAELMLRMITDPAYNAPLTFYDAMRVYMTGRQFLDVLQHNTDLLLNGFIPPHPEVKQSAAPPPPMPVVPLPPGDTVQRFSTIRSINCIKNITECLARFGVRWGYMSWNQRYQNETATMLDELNQRLRELGDFNGARKQSMWQQGSIPSSNGSISYGSPSQQFTQASNTYNPIPSQIRQSQSFGENGQPSNIRQSSPPLMRQTQSFGESGFLPQTSPSQYPQQPNMYSQQQPAVGGYPFPQQQSQQPPPFDFSDRTTPQPAPPVAQNHFFSGWGGYDGPAVVDSLDEENADPCYNGAAQHNLHRVQYMTGSGPAMSELPQGQLLAPVASNLSSWPAPPIRSYGAASNQLLATGQRAPLPCSMETPLTSIFPPLSGTPPVAGQSITPRPYRRISMHDAALDVLQTTYPPPEIAFQDPESTASAAQGWQDKGKARAKEQGFANMRQGPSMLHLPVSAGQVTGFGHQEDVGVVCIVCGRRCPRPELHKMLTDGKGCVDLEPPPCRMLDSRQQPPQGGAEGCHPEAAFEPAIRPSLVEMMRAHAASGPVIGRGEMGSVDLDLQQTQTNDSLLMQDPEQGEVIATEAAESSADDLIQNWMFVESARKMSESCGLFF